MLRLRIEPVDGEDAETVAADLQATADRLGLALRCRVDGAETVTYPGEDSQQLIVAIREAGIAQLNLEAIADALVESQKVKR